uniref:Uncharacterized protein n=1 Tax=uncultured marine virus TaxID=186617 RepID=A0A0F7L608_9VIRU|nr:hypothetical protein [uncultured marine virus]
MIQIFYLQILSGRLVRKNLCLRLVHNNFELFYSIHHLHLFLRQLSPFLLHYYPTQNYTLRVQLSIDFDMFLFS